MTSFASELRTYVGRVRLFDRRDWMAYTAWVGLMLGLTAVTLVFVLVGRLYGAPIPDTAWLLPAGAATFTIAIAVDTVGHRTIYREAIARAEGFVHRITIFFGIGSCILLCAAFRHRVWFIPATVFAALSFVYSLVDEAFHWHRYWTKKSDVVEMWSHVFILVGHGTMMGGWWLWCLNGYPGVSETLSRWALS